MQRPQWITLGVALGVLLLMYFGCPTQAPEMVTSAAQRSLSVEATSPQALIRAARESLTPLQKATLGSLEESYDLAESDTARVRTLEKLAAEWYQADQPGISGHYAQEIAELQDTLAASWAMAGTTYSICVRETTSEKEKTFCTQRAIKAYQAAISLEPDEMSHRLNLALTHTYNPPADNPMKGILMLRELQQNNPEDTRVLITLAQLAVQTNQLDRAAERLSQAAALEPENPEPICLLARVYEMMNQATAAADADATCQRLRNQAGELQ